MSAPTKPFYTTIVPTGLNFFAKEAVLARLFTVLMIFVVLHGLSGTAADPDLWGYMAFGRAFWETGQFLYQDIFAYVPTLKNWVYHEWLTGVVFYPVYRTLGAAGLQTLKLFLGLATVWCVYLTARRRGADFWSALLGLWFVQVFLGTGYSPVRAQVFTYFFFALSLLVLESARLSGRWRGLALLVVIQLPWCNLHGGFLAGLGLLALYAVGEAISQRPFWPYLATLAAASLVTLINPYGLEYWAYLFRAVTMPRPEISEWASLIMAWQTGFPKGALIYFVSLAVFSAFLVWWAEGWREVTPTLILALTLYMGCKHLRHQVFFLLAAGAYLPLSLQAYGKKILTLLPQVFRHSAARPVLTALAVGMLVAYGVKILKNDPLSLQLPEIPDKISKAGIHYPVGALEFLQQNNLSGHILSEFHWGEYLIWLLYPSCKVAMDGRFETVYGDDLCHLHSEFIYGRPGWRKILEQYPPDLILIDPRSKVYALLKDSPDWRLVYEDAGGVLFVPMVGTNALSPQKF